jgi:1-acyl-sn-glycerol-3-phosphate acyltransferase
LISEDFRHRCRIFANTLFSAFFGLRVEGVRNVPRTGPLLVACNHISELDPPVLGSAFPRALFFMAKKELFRKGFWASFFRNLGAFPVDRRGADREALRVARELLEEGNAVAVFPEGTRSIDGRMLSPKPGLGYLAVATGAGILPVHISGTNSPVSAVFRRTRFRVRFGRVIAGRPKEETGSSREEYISVSSRVMEAISGLADAPGPVPARERKG